jgi:hypothetical protein
VKDAEQQQVGCGASYITSSTNPSEVPIQKPTQNGSAKNATPIIITEKEKHEVERITRERHWGVTLTELEFLLRLLRRLGV